MPEVGASLVEFVTADGIELTGDLALPASPRAAAIVCHPHPSYGGNRHDHVVAALFAALPAVGVAALRFDFRAEFGGGVAEVADAAAAVESVRAELLRLEVPECPVIASGYSFGAMVALALDPTTTPLAGKLLVAPPLSVMALPATVDVPTLVLTPEHDQFTPPAAADPIVERWERATLETIPMADHFLHGRTAPMVDAALGWIDRLLG